VVLTKGTLPQGGEELIVITFHGATSGYMRSDWRKENAFHDHGDGYERRVRGRPLIKRKDAKQ